MAAGVAYAGVKGYGGLLWDVLGRLSVLKRDPVRDVLVRPLDYIIVPTIVAMTVSKRGLSSGR